METGGTYTVCPPLHTFLQGAASSRAVQRVGVRVLRGASRARGQTVQSQDSRRASSGHACRGAAFFPDARGVPPSLPRLRLDHGCCSCPRATRDPSPTPTDALGLLRCRRTAPSLHLSVRARIQSRAEQSRANPECAMLADHLTCC